jgi:hypothetical protein
LRNKTNQLPLWAKIIGGILGTIVIPASIGLGGWALAKCDTLGERVRACEVKGESTDSMLSEIRSDVKELLRKGK